MCFNNFEFLVFILIVIPTYWFLKNRTYQNIFLVLASYFFYGFFHPWYCYLLITSTITDYFCGLGMHHHPNLKKVYLSISLTVNLGMLAFFKYSNFFLTNISNIFNIANVSIQLPQSEIILPVGISFYTFQTLSYTLDIYKGHLTPKKNFINFSLFVASFPQLVAGPIERAKRFIPQIEKVRKWNKKLFLSCIPLILQGYLKKIVIADNMAIYVNNIFILNNPPIFLVFIGAIAFSLQIYMDFSAYTDIARGIARMMGFRLSINFNQPYLAITPSDFWKRWHITFSSWIKDYLYISLGGSKVKSNLTAFLILFVTLGLSGLWHGAAWKFIIWGIYHACLIFVYRLLGFNSRWKPRSKYYHIIAICIMYFFNLIGWLIFRCINIEWLYSVFVSRNCLGNFDQIYVSFSLLVLILFCFIPLLFVRSFIKKVFSNRKMADILFCYIALFIILILGVFETMNFIYFQF